MVMTRRTGESSPGMLGKGTRRSSRSNKVIGAETDYESDIDPNRLRETKEPSNSPVTPPQQKKRGLSVTLTDSAEETHPYTSRSGRKVISNKLFNDFDSTPKYFKKSKNSSHELNSVKNKDKGELSVIPPEIDNFDSSKSADVGENPRYKMKRSSRSTESKVNHVPVVNGDLSYLDDDNNIRRSSRQRKFMYETLNEPMLLGTASFRNGNDHQNAASGFDDVAVKDDMYSIVKGRHMSRRSMYAEKKRGELLHDEDDEESENASSSSDENENSHSKYHLRPKKPSIDRFQPSDISRRKRRTVFNHTTSPARHAFPRSFRSPMFRNPYIKSKHHATHNSSSTSSSSDDEMRFERRKKKSMARSRNHFLPMNFTSEDVAYGTLRDRVKIGSSLADVDPMIIDKSITFEHVGGLSHLVGSLKEMVIFPLLYNKFFEEYGISPPKGVLFHGPPGTGKTLVARALANECSKANHKVAFFMRKGADCLSKWVGESERQLRLLFDQAYAMRPSIIFFDEIDGLAPVRSSRQDQIHSSIVSTLLAHMDGLDSRGEVVIIGATNRIDAIDPALRRPGRFDREFHFPLPSTQAREMILKILTKSWKPALDEAFITDVSRKCVGYCGADIKALCAEAALVALRKKYPQIYSSQDKLVLNISSIRILTEDFDIAIRKIVPAGYRASSNYGRPLPSFLGPILQSVLNNILVILQSIFPQGISSQCTTDAQSLFGPNVTKSISSSKNNLSADSSKVAQNNLSSSLSLNNVSYRPRLLLNGNEGQGQSTHLGPAILHHYENVPVHFLDLPSLYSEAGASPEELCTRIFKEAKRNTPSIIYLPHIDKWWSTVNNAVIEIFCCLLNDMSPSTPVLLLATSDSPLSSLDCNITKLFCPFRKEVFGMKNPSANQRKEFFGDLFKKVAIKPSLLPEETSVQIEELEVAPPPEPRKMSEAEMKKLKRQEENTLRELRIFLREVIHKLVRERKFAMFSKPVDINEVPDYRQVISQPMDLEKMMQKIDLHEYETAKEFIEDIDLICSNALEYNPAKDRDIRHRACAFRDFAHDIIETEMDPEFEKNCSDIHEKRTQRGENPSALAPKHYRTVPEMELENEKPQQISVSDSEVKRKTNSCNGVKVKKRATSSFIKSRKNLWYGGRRRRRLVKCKKVASSPEKSCTDEKMDVEEDSSKEKSSNEENKVKQHSSSTSQGSSSPANHNARKNSEIVESVSDASPNVLVNGCSEDDLETNEKELTIDINRLKELLCVIVDHTKDSSIDNLESLYITLQSSINKYSCTYNKLPLIQEMEEKVKKFKEYYYYS